ncbi:MAG: ribonuclease P subunit p25 family protein [Candidatus Hermodarchaeota archaeon]
MDNNIFYIKNRRDKDKIIKDAIFAFSGGQKLLLIKGEGDEISTAVEIAEILKSRLYPGIEIGNVHLGSRPFYERRKKGNYHRNPNNKNKKDLISQIEITLQTII